MYVDLRTRFGNRGNTILGRFWDNWATRHRNWEAILTLVGVTAILAWAAVQLSSAEIVRINFESAVVKEVKSSGLSAAAAQTTGGGETALQIGTLELKDGTTVEVLLVPPIPKAGDRVPLKIEHYTDGVQTYSVDRVRWQMHGSE